MIRKKEGFQGQQAIVIPRKILLEKCIHDPVNSPLFITDIGYYPKARFHYRKRINGADQHILIYCVEGKGTITLKKQVYPIMPGDCFLIPRKWSHAYGADEQEPWTIYWAHFTGSNADGITEMAIQQCSGHQTFLSHSDERLQLFRNIYQQLERGYRQENLLYANMHFWSFLASCIFPGSYAPGKLKPEPDTIDKAIDHMNSEVHHMLTLQQMAAAVNLSPSHFSYLFKTNTGYSPIEYFNQLKVQKACQYLLFTNLRIKEVAAQLGMADAYYFSRLFTKIMGMSPNQYREKATGS